MSQEAGDRPPPYTGVVWWVGGLGGLSLLCGVFLESNGQFIRRTRGFTELSGQKRKMLIIFNGIEDT
jgi:hypothetical protein